jgi:hypothetical protein
MEGAMLKTGDLVEVISLGMFCGATGVVTRRGDDWRETVFVFFPQVGRELQFTSHDLVSQPANL